MLSNIYDRLYFIQEDFKKVGMRLDSLERFVGKSRLKRLNTLYGEQKKKWLKWLKFWKRKETQ